MIKRNANVKENGEKKEDLSYLQTVGRALKVLTLFQEKNMLSLVSIAEQLGVSKTIAYRLVHTLAVDGFLFQDPTTKQYLLGDKLLMLGFCTVQRQDVKRIAHDLLWNFHERTQISAYLTIPCAKQSLCVDRVVSSSTGRLSTVFVGGVYPLHCGASNRVLLAFRSRQFQEKYIATLDLSEEKKEQLRKELLQARELGYDFTRNGLTEGLFAVGFPIYNSSNQLVAGLSVGGTEQNGQPCAVERCIEQGRLLAIEINNQMGSNYYSALVY